MGSFLKLIGILFFSFVLLQSCGEEDNKESKSKSAAEIRLENADSSQKACVKTLGQGVYKNKSLYWR